MTRLPEPGGSPGGLGSFLAGVALSGTAAWFFVDSVRVSSDRGGWISGLMGGSAGVVFLPLVVGVIGLFYDAREPWAWLLSAVGFLIIMIEVLSRLQFFFNLKLSHLLIMIVSFAAGIGLVLRSFRSFSQSEQHPPPWHDAFDRSDR